MTVFKVNKNKNNKQQTKIKINKNQLVSPVPLGSIPEMPAESCSEIKASEGGKAVSGGYWFDSIIPGKTIQLHCDMEAVGRLRKT